MCDGTQIYPSSDCRAGIMKKYHVSAYGALSSIFLIDPGIEHVSDVMWLLDSEGSLNSTSPHLLIEWHHSLSHA